MTLFRLNPMRTTRGLILSLMMFFLVACQENAIHHKLAEDDANEILVMLDQHGIEAKKVAEEKNQEITWNVVVPKKNEARARALLGENHLPRNRAMGFNEVCKEEGLIPTPKREKCRELLAYKGEIINALEKIAGVVDADVVLNIPDKDPYLEAGMANLSPTASVVVELNMSAPGAVLLKDEQLQRFVANAVPGMDARNVSVVVSVSTGSRTAVTGKAMQANVPSVTMTTDGLPAQAESVGARAVSGEYKHVFGMRLHVDSVERFKKVAMIVAGIFLMLSAFLLIAIYMYLKGRPVKKGVVSESKTTELLSPASRTSDGLLESPTS